MTENFCIKNSQVFEVPKTISEEVVGEFILNLNDCGEISISNKYEPTTFVIEDKQTKEFIEKLSKLQSDKE